MAGNGTSNSGNAHCGFGGDNVGGAARCGMLGGTPNSGVGHAMSIEISGTSGFWLTALSGTAAFFGAAFCGVACAAATSAASGAAFSAAVFRETDFSITRSAGFGAGGRWIG